MVIIEAVRVKGYIALLAPIARPATAVGAPSVDGGVAEDDEVPNVVIPHNLLASLGQSRCG